MKENRKFQQRALPGMLCLMLTAAVLACQATASQTSPYTPTKESQSTPDPMAGPDGHTPYLLISPNTGGSGTRVTADGTGFPSNTDVVIYYGPNLEEAYVLMETGIKTDAEGNFRARFLVPGQWPDGDAIGEDEVFIQAATADDLWFAWSAFSYHPDVGTDQQT